VRARRVRARRVRARRVRARRVRARRVKARRVRARRVRASRVRASRVREKAVVAKGSRVRGARSLAAKRNLAVIGPRPVRNLRQAATKLVVPKKAIRKGAAGPSPTSRPTDNPDQPQALRGEADGRMAMEQPPTRSPAATATPPRPKPNGGIRTPRMPATLPIWRFGH